MLLFLIGLHRRFVVSGGTLYNYVMPLEPALLAAILSWSYVFPLVVESVPIWAVSEFLDLLNVFPLRVFPKTDKTKAILCPLQVVLSFVEYVIVSFASQADAKFVE